MEIINDNIPYDGEKIHLILVSSLLNKSIDILYSLNNKNFLLINNYFLEYSSISIDNNPINNNNISSTIINNLINKSDSTIIILSDSKKDSNAYLTSLKNIFNKNNYKDYNINSISYMYNYINKNNKKYETYDISSIPKIENNNLFIKIKIEFNNDIIYNCFKILIINNSYESICPFFCLNRKDYELIFIKEKINKLLLEEKIIKDEINKLPLLHIDFIENINSFKKETFDYFNKFINSIEKMKNYFNSKLLTKNDFNNFIKEVNNFYDKITKESYKNKQNNVYREYIQTYKDINNICISNKCEANLKSLFINLNNLNEEIVNFLDNNDLNKKEITNLKNIIKFLQNELKQEKSKNLPKINNNNSDINNLYNIYMDNNNVFLTNNKSMNKINNSKKKSFNKTMNLNKSLSVKKYNRNHKRNISMDSSNNINNRTFEDNKHNKNYIKYLNKKISQLNDIIANLKSNNEILEKSNEKMKKDINNLNKIVSKLQREKEENNLIIESIPKSSSIKNIKPKIFNFKEKKEFPGQKDHIKNKNLFLNNINNDNDIIFSRNNKTKNNNNNYNNTSMIDDKHYEILKKIYEENKNMSKIINNYYFNNSELNFTHNNFNIKNNEDKNNSFINNSTSKKVKKKKKIYYNNLKLNLNTDKKVNKNTSAPKIKILKTNYQK